MAKQRRPGGWEERAKELAGKATEQVIPDLEKELKAKQEQLREVEAKLQEASVAQLLDDKTRLGREIRVAEGELEFAQRIVPQMVESAGKTGHKKDRVGKGCFS